METKRSRPEVIVISIIGFLAVGVFIFPIIWLFLSSFKPSTELFAYPLHLFPLKATFEAYKNVIAGGFFIYVKNSLYLAVAGTLITLIISAMCGYALAIYRKEIPYVNKVFAVFLLGTLIPGFLQLHNSVW